MRRRSFFAPTAALPLPPGAGRGAAARRGLAAGRPLPRGLTLVELLVTVSILAMIMALLTPTLMGARRSAMNAKVKSEIDLLHMALMNYKNEYGSFPPANFGPVPNIGSLWVSDSVGVNTRHPVYRHLVRIFPRLAEAKNPNEVTAFRNGPLPNYPTISPFKNLAQLSPAQALVFWLRGFYENPEYPLTNGGAPGQRKKLFDFDESRLYAASDYTNPPQTFTTRDKQDVGSVPREYPVYFTGQQSSGLPYVYFDSRCYDVQPTTLEPLPDMRYQARPLNGGEASVAMPYLTSDPPANPLWSQFHVNPDTFQLIASGLDGRYGPGPTADFSQVQAAFPNALTGSVSRQSAGVLAGHLDNITNFAPKPLAEAVSALKTD